MTLFRKPASQHVIVMQEFTPVLWSAPFDFTTSGLLQFPVFLPKYLLSSSFYRSTMAAKEGDPPDFSEAWLFSDVVFVVEDKKFHVHRYVLAQWSPVFETMFSSEFKEKNLSEIPLPDKKASEFKELLLLIYPTISGKALNTINNTNCHCLLRLAREYQMDVIYQKCEEFMVSKIQNASGNTFMADLIFAQTYNFEKLLKISIDKAISNISQYNDFKSHELFDQIKPDNFKQIAEGIILRHEKATARCNYCSRTAYISR